MHLATDTYRPKTLNLTLSVLLKFDQKSLMQLTKIQDRLMEGVHYSTCPNNYSLYKYFPESLHFSLINFVTEEFTSGDPRKDFETKYAKLTDKVREETPK